VPVVERKIPLITNVSRAQDIRDAIAFAERANVRIVVENGRIQRFDDRCVEVRHPMFVGVRAERRAFALGRGQVLDGEGNAVHRSAQLARSGFAIELRCDRQRLLRIDEAEAIELRIHGGNPGEAVLDHARGRQRTGANATRDLGCRHVAEVEIDGHEAL